MVRHARRGFYPDDRLGRWFSSWHRQRLPVIKKLGTLAKKTSDSIWKNKGSIAVGTAAAVVLTNPEAATAAVTGTTDIVTEVVAGTTGIVAEGVSRNTRQSGGSGSVIPAMIFYLVLAGLVILGTRYLLHRVGIWKLAVPLLIVGVLFCCGVAEAGVLDFTSIPEIECKSFPKLPWMNLITIALIILSFFIGGAT